MRLLISMPRTDVRDSFLPPDAIESLHAYFEVEENPYERQFTRAELAERLPHFDAVVTGWGHERIDRALLGDAPRLGLIAHTGGSVGDLIAPEVYDAGIRVLSGNRLFAESVAEGTLAYILSGLRRMPESLDVVKAGGWAQGKNEGLFDRTVGIVGFGAISRHLIPMLRLFRCRILLFSHHLPDDGYLSENGVTPATLDEVFSSSDVVSVHSALNPENRSLIGAHELSLLRDGALFINTSRGAVVDEAALISELQTGRIRAVLDVFATEPPAENSPLRALPNVYAYPHVAGPTYDRRGVIGRTLAREVIAFFERGEIPTLEITAGMAKSMTRH